MSVISTTANQCDFLDCGHVWLSRDRKTKPSRCGACKRPNWDKGGVAQSVEPGSRKAYAGSSPAASTKKPARPAHDPKTCRLRGCGLCRAAKGVAQA